MVHIRSFHPDLGLAMTGLMLFLGALAGCNMPQGRQSTPQSVNVTQAYQTVEARLTEAVTQTAGSTGSPAATDSGCDRSNRYATTASPDRNQLRSGGSHCRSRRL